MILMPHIETIWAAKVARASELPGPQIYQRERWLTSDDDFIDVDFLPQHADQLTKCTDSVNKPPLWVMFHGLEGSSQSHYARAFARFASVQGFNFCVPHFRGCSGQINLAPRAYHSGDFQEVGWVLKRIKEQYSGDIYAIGISLGGNALMRWAGEVGSCAARFVNGVVSISAPLDMVASGRHIGLGLNRYLYTPMFLKSMKKNALFKLDQYPGLFNRQKLLACRTLYEFDNVFTAPLHGFKDTNDYWSRASAKPHLSKIDVPALVINALNDPFIPVDSLPKIRNLSKLTQLWQPKHGGHVGFTEAWWSQFPGHLQKLPNVVHNFFKTGNPPREDHNG